MIIASLEKCTPEMKATVLAYINSWPCREKTDPDAALKKAEMVIKAQPECVFTTPEIWERCKDLCPDTQPILSDNPCIPFGMMCRQMHSEGKFLQWNEYPGVWIIEKTRIGVGTRIEPGTVVGGSSVSADEFGGKIVRRPQFGRVRIGNDVYIGANCSIERGTLPTDETVIDSNCILDSGVKISHNCKLESSVVILGNAVLEGHVTVKHKAYVSCNAVIHRGVTIGERAVIGAGAIVLKDVPAGEVWVGNPARPLNAHS